MALIKRMQALLAQGKQHLANGQPSAALRVVRRRDASVQRLCESAAGRSQAEQVLAETERAQPAAALKCEALLG